MARGHPNGNQDLEVDDTAFVELMQQNDEKLKQRHTEGETGGTVFQPKIRIDV
jgi:hypothetical protein